MILIFIIYTVIALWLAFVFPKYFITFYILASTKFLGFFDTESLFVFQGIGVGGPTLHIIMFFVIIFKGPLKKIPRRYRFYISGILGLLFYGIMRPYVLELESFFEAIMASKEFWTITFLLYLIKFRKKIDLNYFTKLIIPLGTYLSFTYIIYSLIRVSPPFYISDDVFRAYFPTYISLALFFVYYLQISKKIKTINFLIYSFVFVIGLILAEHSSITITSIGLIMMGVLVLKGRPSLSFYTLFRGTILALLSVFLIIINESLKNQVSQILSNEDVALSSRDSYNVFRWEAINDSPFFGYGFVHKNANINEKYMDFTSSRFTERFEVIDSGYVDILIKFGVIGLVLILIVWGSIIKIAFRGKDFYDPMKIVCGLYLAQYFLINYTWSVFTYAHGLIPAFIVIFIILAKSDDLKNKYV